MMRFNVEEPDAEYSLDKPSIWQIASTGQLNLLDLVSDQLKDSKDTEL